MPTKQEIEQEKLNDDGSSTDGCLDVLLMIFLPFAAIIAALLTRSLT